MGHRTPEERHDWALCPSGHSYCRICTPKHLLQNCQPPKITINTLQDGEVNIMVPRGLCPACESNHFVTIPQHSPAHPPLDRARLAKAMENRFQSNSGDLEILTWEQIAEEVGKYYDQSK